MRQFPLMIFAAGFGTRMGKLTQTMPKPLIPVAGRALIDHALDLTQAAPIGRIVANVHYLGAQLEHHLAGRNVAVSWERDQILETGGGLKAALPLLGDGPVMTLNSDAIWTGPNPLQRLASGWRDGMGGLLLVAPPDRLTGRAPGPADFVMADDGRLRRANGASEGVVYLGAQIVRSETVSNHAETVFSMNRIWDDLIAKGLLFGITHSGGWCDVGSPSGIKAAEDMLRADHG